jgi:hypothetical protein
VPSDVTHAWQTGAAAPLDARRTWLAVLALSVAAALVLVVPAPGWLNVLVVMPFCLLAPGLAVVGYLQPRERPVAWVVVAATGAPLWALVATTEAFFGWWAPWGTVLAGSLILVGISAPSLRFARGRAGRWT